MFHVYLHSNPVPNFVKVRDEVYNIEKRLI